MSDLLPVKAPTKQELVQRLGEIDAPYNNYLQTLAPEKLARIKQSVSNTRHGLHTVAPTMCMGPHECMFIEHCPIPPRTEAGAPILDQNGKMVYGPMKDYPVARPCVMEKFYMQQKIMDYVQHLDVDPANPVEMAIVNELAVLDLMKNRALIVLSKGDKAGQGRDFLRVDITGFSDSGVPSESTSIHPVAEYLDKMEKRRERWLDKLLETRKAKIDAAHKLGNTQNDSKVLDELRDLKKALESVSMQAIAEAEEVVEVLIDD